MKDNSQETWLDNFVTKSISLLSVFIQFGVGEVFQHYSFASVTKAKHNDKMDVCHILAVLIFFTHRITKTILIRLYYHRT